MQENINIRCFEMEQDFGDVFLLDHYINGERAREEVYQEIKNYSGNIYITEFNKNIAGLVSLSRSFWNKVAMIDHLAVGEKYRRLGVGKLLVNHVLKEAQKKNIRFVCVQTAQWNIGAIDFYKRMGFCLRGIFTEYLGDRNDMVWLDKDIREGI